jgi:hypothetical protein
MSVKPALHVPPSMAQSDVIFAQAFVTLPVAAASLASAPTTVTGGSGGGFVVVGQPEHTRPIEQATKRETKVTPMDLSITSLRFLR